MPLHLAVVFCRRFSYASRGRQPVRPAQVSTTRTLLSPEARISDCSRQVDAMCHIGEVWGLLLDGCAPKRNAIHASRTLRDRGSVFFASDAKSCRDFTQTDQLAGSGAPHELNSPFAAKSARCRPKRMRRLERKRRLCTRNIQRWRAPCKVLENHDLHKVYGVTRPPRAIHEFQIYLAGSCPVYSNLPRREISVARATAWLELCGAALSHRAPLQACACAAAPRAWQTGCN